MSSRTLKVRVDTGLVDPMEREFKHNRPVDWTKANRERILGALYTILLGNQKLDTAADEATWTRFPMWYRLVGSAVEHAAKCYRNAYPEEAGKAEAVDYSQIFKKQNCDEEGTSLGEMLYELGEVLHTWKAKGENAGYTAKEIASCLNQSCWLQGNSMDGSSSGIATVRGFLFQKLSLRDRLSPHAITRALGAYVDRRWVFGSEELVLRVSTDTHTKGKLFMVERMPQQNTSVSAGDAPG
jgi:hypothetical protein